MITGPITENENNPNKIWGSWVYKGGHLTLEIKTPVSTKEQLLLHSNNIAYGYKEVYKTKVGGFGQSGACNINVLCPLGTGWEPERNSVAVILNANGIEFCSGSMIMNSCNSDRPFFLTANHCYATNPVQNVAAWRFTFQAWSATCTPSQNSNGVTYNGSTLRSNWANSDFCLVELNNTPPSNSGIHYAGWTTSTTPAQNATGIHHPRGDVMKISAAANPVTIASAFGTTNQHWRADWTQGVTEGGSSGSPLFDQSHRIIGQLNGGPSACGGSQLWDFYGRFDLSWTGGGTNATRLSNWLDPYNIGSTTTNTTNVSSLAAATGDIVISGPNEFCVTGTYTLPAGSLCGATVTWSLGYLNNYPNVASLSCTNCTSTTLTKINNGTALLIATVIFPNSNTTYTYEKYIGVGTPVFKGWYNSPTNSAEPLNPWTRTQPNSNEVCYGAYISTTTDITANATVTWQESGNSGGLTWWQSGNNLHFYFSDIDQWAYFTVTVINSCGTTSIRYRFNSVSANCSGGMLLRVAASPNPATNTVNVSLVEKEGLKNKKEIKQIRIIDKMGILMKSFEYGNGNTEVNINVNNLSPDVYTIIVFDGKQWYSARLIKN